METAENEKILKYLDSLKRATSDNEKFASLLMVAKVTKDAGCSIDVKKDILEAVGSTFFSRLLKTKSVPEECSPNIYKGVAMSILSALCSQPDVACSPVMTENVTSFNNIILLDPSEDDIEGRQLVDDTYECYNSLCQTSTGMHCLVGAKSVASLTESVVNQSYGHEKAQDILYCIVSCAGGPAWDGCEASFHRVMTHTSHTFQQDNTEKKFELCKTLVFLLQSAPRKLEKSSEPPWIRQTVSGLDAILRSKIGPTEREPALRLASMLVQVLGIYSILPPYTADSKLFLLTTHLCCIEIRMVLEDTDINQASDNGRLLSSCYSYLENIINHMTSGPALNLDDRQVLQLHAAMVGAFSAVLHFLKRVALDVSVQWNSIILATVRVLGAWLAEETSALKEEVYELIPFLMQISKMCLPPNYEKSITKEPENSDPSKTPACDNVSNTDDQNKHSDPAVTTDCDTEMETDELSSEMAKVTCTEAQSGNKTPEMKEADDEMGEETANLETNSDFSRLVQDSNPENDKESKTCDTNSENQSNKTENHVTFADQSEAVNSENVQTNLNSAENEDMSGFGDLKPDQGKLSEKELQELHLRVDIIHFLLPGLCHLTSEDLPRKVLLHCGALSILDLYMWRQWEYFAKYPSNRETQSSLVILCNIFLNLIIVEPSVAIDNLEFCHILLLVAKGIKAVELDENFIVIWSHLVTLGLMLMRALAGKTDEFLESDSVTEFFVSCIKFLSGAYITKHKKKGKSELTIADMYRLTWDQISQTWFLSMQALSACIPLYPVLSSILLQSGWIPALLKTFNDVKVSGVAEEKSCFLLLLTTIANSDTSAKAIIKEKGGMEFAKLYKSPDLLSILQS